MKIVLLQSVNKIKNRKMPKHVLKVWRLTKYEYWQEIQNSYEIYLMRLEQIVFISSIAKVEIFNITEENRKIV